MSLTDERRAAVGASIRAIPDFPKKGILFQDVTTLLLHPKVGERERCGEKAGRGQPIGSSSAGGG